MSDKKRKIALLVIGILIMITITLGLTRAFMKNIITPAPVTNVSLKSCANLTLIDGGNSINLTNTNPMTDNIGLKTTPYEFTVKNTCAGLNGFRVYLATIASGSTLPANKLKFAIKEKETGNLIATGLVGNQPENTTELSDEEIAQFTKSIGVANNAYIVLDDALLKDEERTYELYLWVDSSVTDASAKQSIKVGLIAKSLETYTNTFAEKIINSVDTDATLYKHDTNLENSANDNSIRYSGANYALTTKASSYSNVEDTNSAANGVIKMYCSRGDTYSYVGSTGCTSSYTKYYYLAYDTNKTQYNTYFAAAKKAVTDGYLKSNVNNYVCFGSDATTCPDDNLYRIIGVFNNKVKLIKADYANSNMLGTDGDYSTTTISDNSYPRYKGGLKTANIYYWNYTTNNKISKDWHTSSLNNTNLNTNYINYLNNINAKWVNMIADTMWNIGPSYNELRAKEFYNIETTQKTSDSSKIGLMYASDYGFATIPSKWANDMYSYSDASVVNNNWMYMGFPEWTIITTPSYETDGYIYIIYQLGNIDWYLASDGLVVRPTFYLKPSVKYVSGTGSLSSPYKIGL